MYTLINNAGWVFGPSCVQNRAGEKAIFPLEFEKNVVSGNGNFRINGSEKDVVEIVFKINAWVISPRSQDRSVKQWKSMDIFGKGQLRFFVTGSDLVFS